MEARQPVRTVLVVAAQPQPWALLRDRLDPALIVVSWALPAASAQAAARLRPWPWAVAAEPGLIGAAAGNPGRPVLRIGVRGGLTGWTDACRRLERALARDLSGLRLAPARGLRLPDGTLLGSCPELEALLGAGPRGLRLAARHRRRAEAQVAGCTGLELAIRHGSGRSVLCRGPDADAS